MVIWQDIYEMIWLGEATNNCNLIEGRGFLRKQHGQGDEAEIHEDRRPSAW